MDNRRKYKMLAIDMDGTLLTDTKTISEGNLAALRQAMEAGVRVCISTGRAWMGSKKHIDVLKPNAAVSNSNGSMITDPATGEILFSQKLKASEALHIYEEGLKAGTTMIIWSQNRFYTNRLDDMSWDYSRRFANVDPILLAEEPGGEVPDFAALAERGISKILWHAEPAKIQAWLPEVLAHDYGEITKCTSEPDMIEFYSCYVSKARSIEYIGSLYGIGLDEIVAMGDGENDIPMLQAAGLGVAMINAASHVQAAADLVTTRDNNHDGVAEIVYRYFLDRRRD